MKTCVFFGHRDSSEGIKSILKKAIIFLIEEQGVERFLVGHHGAFDRMALAVLRELSNEYSFVFNVVLSFVPDERNNKRIEHWEETLLPEGLEKVPPKYGIIFRNKWMVDQADWLIVYVEHPFGGAVKFLEIAKKKNKRILYLKNDGVLFE